MADRNEFASFASLAIANRGDILIKGIEQRFVMSFLNTVRKMGANFEISNQGIRFFNNEDVQYKPIVIETDIHPGFMTD
jgi:UDP-N-acetylglucosamine 1-carboxyvinyltransferase